MIQVDIWGLICIMGVPTAFTGLCVWLIQRSIARRDKKRDKAEAERIAAEEERERAREQLQLLTIKSVNASIALGEATARAVQRIPDAHCNGDMHAALDYAAQIKHEARDFLSQQGIHAVI